MTKQHPIISCGSRTMRVCAKQRQRSSTVRPELNRQPWGIWAGSIRHRITKADFRNAPAPPTVRFAAVPVFGFDRVENELRYCNMKRGQMSHVGQNRKSRPCAGCLLCPRERTSSDRPACPFSASNGSDYCTCWTRIVPPLDVDSFWQLCDSISFPLGRPSSYTPASFHGPYSHPVCALWHIDVSMRSNWTKRLPFIAGGNHE